MLFRSQRSRSGDARRVHPGTPRDVKADPCGCAAEPRQQGGARSAVKVDRDVEPIMPKAKPEEDVGVCPSPSSVSVRDDELVQMRVSSHDRFRRRLDQVREMRRGKALAQRVNRRGRKNDVADLAQTDEEDSQSRN